jgi:hypothetical protein
MPFLSPFALHALQSHYSRFSQLDNSYYIAETCYCQLQLIE